MKTMLSICVLSILCVGCGSSTDQHLGTWEGEIDGEKTTFTFEDKAFTAKGEKMTMKGTYTIDYSKSPTQMDLAMQVPKFPDPFQGKGPAKGESEKKPEMETRTLKLIVEFPDGDTLRMVGEKGRDKPRPASFEGAKDIVTLKRKK